MINKKLNKILLKYFKEEGKNEINKIEFIGKIMQKISNESFIIWGAGEHTLELHKYFPEEINKARYIVDVNESLQGKKLLNKQIQNVEFLKRDSQTNIILISSHSSCESIKRYIEEEKIGKQVIDLYDELKKNGLDYKGAFYSYIGDSELCNTLKKEYYKAKSIEEKKIKIKNVIFQYLKIFDFINAIKYIDEAIYLKLDHGRYMELKNEIIDFLNNIKKELRKRKEKDIFIFLLDALRKEDINIENMPFLKSFSEKNIEFNNMFSPSITTYESVPSILTGFKPFDKRVKDVKTVDEKDVDFIKWAKKNDYKISLISIPMWDIINGDECSHKSGGSFSTSMWRIIEILMNSKNKKNLILLYEYQETHPPHICANHFNKPIKHSTPFSTNIHEKQSQEDYNKQYYECLKYVDLQLEYYFEFLKYDNYKIIFSDHGQNIENVFSKLSGIGTRLGWHTDRFRVPLIISDSETVKQINDNHSLLDLNKILINVFEKNIKFEKREYNIIQFPKMNNCYTRGLYINDNCMDYIDGFSVYIFDKYKLVLSGCGKVHLYRLDDEENELNDEFIKRKLINSIQHQDLLINKNVFDIQFIREKYLNRED